MTPDGHRGRLFERAAMPGLGLLCLALLLASSDGFAHIVYGSPTIRQLTRTADLAARVRIVDPDARVRLENPLTIEAVVVAEVLEVLKGAETVTRLRFVQHGHGVPIYEKGEEALLFLQRIERSPEFSASRIARRIRWVSVQESTAHFTLGEGSRREFADAVRAYVEIESLPPDARLAALGRLTLDLLGSSEPRLAASALRDLVVIPDPALITKTDLPRLESILSNPATPIGHRIGLLAELERRSLVDGPARWLELLRSTKGTGLFAVVRAAAAHPSPGVTAELIRLLGSEDGQLAAAAAVSLGVPGNEAAVAPLTKLLSAPELRLRMAAIRGLGRIATPEVLKVLSSVADDHPDAATRKRAAAEVRLLSRRAPSPSQAGEPEGERS